MTKLPRLYNKSGTFNRVLNIVSASVTLNLTPLATASIRLQKGETIPLRSYVEMFTPYGSAGMFRVASPSNAYGNQDTTVELEHMITEVGDYLVKEEIDEMVAANSAMSRVWKGYKGSLWKLGAVSPLGTGKIALSVSYDRVLDAMLAILEQVPDCMMSFDFSKMPWTVNIVKKPTTVSAECRLSRNANSAQITYDDSELCTRVYYQTYTTKNNETTAEWKYKDAPTKSTYGIVERTVNTSQDMTAEEINNVVNTYLNEHQKPRISIRIDAEELSAITGESMDKFTIPKLLRLTIPENSLVVEENINSLSWGDVYNAPYQVTVSIGDEPFTVVSYLHNLDATGRGGGGGGGGGKKEEEEQWKEYYTTFEKTDKLIQMTANHVDRNNNILEQAGLKLNSRGTLIYSKDAVNGLAAKFSVMNDNINLCVRKNGVISAINVSPESIIIKSQRVNLVGYVKATDLTTDYFKSKISSIGQVTMQNATVNGGMTCFGRVTGNVVSGMSMELGGASFSNVLVSASVSGNTLTLTNQRGQTTTFSKATTLSGSWSGGTFMVVADPQGNTCETTITGGTAYRDGSILCIPVTSDRGSTGKEVYAALTSRSGCVSGLTSYGAGTLYYKGGDDDYYSAGNHNWYYRNGYNAPTTWYTFG